MSSVERERECGGVVLGGCVPVGYGAERKGGGRASIGDGVSRKSSEFEVQGPRRT